jgi:hypothetical protein
MPIKNISATSTVVPKAPQLKKVEYKVNNAKYNGCNNTGASKSQNSIGKK